MTDQIGSDRIRTTLGAVDVLIWVTEDDAERAALVDDPDLAGAIADRSVFPTVEEGAAIMVGSPLSYPVLAEKLPGPIAGVVG